MFSEEYIVENFKYFVKGTQLFSNLSVRAFLDANGEILIEFVGKQKNNNLFKQLVIKFQNSKKKRSALYAPFPCWEIIDV